MGLGRYYIKNPFFVEAGIGYGLGEEKKFINDIKLVQDFSSYKYSIGIGMVNFWSKHIKFGILLRFNSTFESDKFSLYGANVSTGIAYIF